MAVAECAWHPTGSPGVADVNTHLPEDGRGREGSCLGVERKEHLQ